MIKKKINYTKIILRWYDLNARNLPWRIKPSMSKKGILINPYHTLISEFMLQQTTVQTVIPYFNNFISKWPSIESLSKASTDDVLYEWAGLGYYSRAKNLLECSKIIQKKFNGNIPKKTEKLLELPGIGPYTAAAICSIAFNKPAVVIDGNVERVISRLFCIKEPIKLSKNKIYDLTKKISCKKRPGDFAQAVMDIGSTVCKKGNPRCMACPVSEYCVAKAENLLLQIPNKLKKKKNPVRYGLVFFSIFQKKYLILEKRPEKGLLAGMISLPTSDWKERKSLINFPKDFKNCFEIEGEINHSFSHFDLKLKVFFSEINHIPERMKIEKISKLNLSNFPKLFQKVIKHSLESDLIKKKI